MRVRFLLVAPAIALIGLGCEGDGPFSVEEYALKEPGSAAQLDSSRYVANGVFAPGYSSGAIQSDEMILHWSCEDPTDFLCYKIFLNGQQISQLTDFAINELPLTALQQNSWYDVRVERVDRSGMHEGHLMALKTARWLSPENVTMNGLSPSEVNVTWTDRSDNEQGFSLTLDRRNNVTGLFDTISTFNVPADQTSYQVSLPDTTFLYRVGVQAYSSFEQNTSTSISPYYTPQFSPVSSLVATQALDSRIVTLSWVDNSTLETSVEIDRFNGPAPQESDWVPVAVLATNSTSWTDADTSSTTVGNIIQYRVRCVNTYQGIRTVTAWRTTNIILVEPTSVPPWDYEAWDGQSFTRTLSTDDRHVYLFHASDDLDIDLCNLTSSMDLVARIWGIDGSFLGYFNTAGIDACEYIADLAGFSDYLIEVSDENGQAGLYNIFIY
jgi:hypothetical protein